MQRAEELSISIVVRLMNLTFEPRWLRMVSSISASLIWGIFSIRQTPSTKSAAGMMATAAFFAPLISTSPRRAVPPLITYFSTFMHLSSYRALARF